MKKTPTLLVLIVLTGIQVWAQGPLQFNYQDVARNTKGSLLSEKKIGVKLSIHDMSPTGPVVYAETDTAVTNSYGVYNVAAGGGTAVIGTFSGIEWSTGAKYIQAIIDPAGGAAYSIEGMSQLLSVAYAVYANKALTTINVSGTTNSIVKFSSPTDLGNSQLYDNGTNIGIGTTTPTARLHISEGSVAFTAAGDVVAAAGNIPASGAGRRMMWYADKGAFRAGYVTGSDWDKDSVGAYSFATGRDTRATGAYAFAAGFNVIARGTNATALGDNTTASGNVSTALGGNTIASSIYSTATGFTTQASGDYSTAMGFTTKAVSTASTAMGSNTIANGSAATAMGYSSTASGQVATAMGNITTAEGNFSTAMGYKTLAQGHFSVAMGQQTIASGINSTALGEATTASGAGATAMGYQTKSTGKFACAMGEGSVATGDYATAMGASCTAGGEGSIACGNQAVTSGGTVALGNEAVASGYGSGAIGNYVTASGEISFAIGNRVTTNGKPGSFIMGDDNTGSPNTMSTAANQMTMRFKGGYKLFTNAGSSIGTQVVAGGNSWSVMSDRRKKENFAPVDGEAFLKKIGKFDLASWNYKTQDPKLFRHYGPMAQDFFAAFGKDAYGVIGNDTTISQSDIEGVSFVAIQALEKRTEQLQKENERLKEEVAALKNDLGVRMTNLEAALSKQEQGKMVKE